MTCDTSMLHGRGVSFAWPRRNWSGGRFWRTRSGRVAAPALWRGGAVAAGSGAPVVVPPGRRDLSRYVIPMLGLYPARGCPFTCNLLRDQDRRAADSQPEHRHHPGQPPRCQGGRRADDHVYLDNSQQVPRGRGAAFGHRGGAAWGWSSSCSAIRRSPDRAPGALPGPRPGASRCSSASSPSTARPVGGPEAGAEPSGDVPRHCPTVPRTRDQLALFQHCGFPQDRSGMCTGTWRCARLGPTFASFYILSPDSRHRAVR
jgi:hypothetical protein